ncbi:hypothetical protein HPP92_005586 [Vanilla planifolia]|uniref:Uncharacterized protein n=1 Tax=Vanilla planifolia TaxID=51239 RepID=A0A835RYY8_VANPL|nr:hypothetical protein HPP92_005586 [Vanilla planifolia]
MEEFIKSENGELHISAKALRIVWGNDQRFWQWTKLPKEETCFEIAAELIQVNWIEVTGSVNLEKFHLDSSKTYEIVYLVRFKVDAFGWHSSPITFEVTTSDGKKNRRTENLEHHKKDGDQWLEIQGGEFTVDSSNLKGKIAFSMKEVRTDWWKGGIVLEGVKIKPKHT